MVYDLAHGRWKKRLLESRKENELYQMIGLNDHGAKDIFFVYRNGSWQFKVDLRNEPVIFTNIDLATDYVISLGVEEYDKEFGI